MTAVITSSCGEQLGDDVTGHMMALLFYHGDHVSDFQLCRKIQTHGDSDKVVAVV